MKYSVIKSICLATLLACNIASATTHMTFRVKNNSNIQINAQLVDFRCMAEIEQSDLTKGVLLNPGDSRTVYTKTIDGKKCDPSDVTFLITELLEDEPHPGNGFPSVLATFNIGGGVADLLKPDQDYAYSFPRTFNYGYYGPYDDGNHLPYYYSLFFKGNLWTNYMNEAQEIDFNRPFY